MRQPHSKSNRVLKKILKDKASSPKAGRAYGGYSGLEEKQDPAKNLTGIIREDTTDLYNGIYSESEHKSYILQQISEKVSWKDREKKEKAEALAQRLENLKVAKEKEKEDEANIYNCVGVRRYGWCGFLCRRNSYQ